MAKTEAEIAAKKEKKEKKRKRESAAEEEVPKKKEKKRKSDATEIANDDVEMAEVGEDEGVEKIVMPLAALVPFAKPLADEKSQKKAFKIIKKAAKNSALKRGVKEVNKAIRKATAGNPADLTSIKTTPVGIVVIAGDISPMDVISHVPVACEDHHLPYFFVPSRNELGAAGGTKRPTAIVMVMQQAGKKKGDDEDDEDYTTAYKDLHKLCIKLGQNITA